MDVRLKRAYETAAPTDGWRVLIDGLWPRGVSRARAQLDAWDKELAPTTELRQWFGHDPQRFEQFRRRYIEELRHHRPQLEALSAPGARRDAHARLLGPGQRAQRRRRAGRG